MEEPAVALMPPTYPTGRFNYRGSGVEAVMGWIQDMKCGRIYNEAPSEVSRKKTRRILFGDERNRMYGSGHPARIRVTTVVYDNQHILECARIYLV